MKKMDNFKKVVKGEPIYQNKNFKSWKRTDLIVKNQQFVVPWQMPHFNEENVLVK